MMACRLAVQVSQAVQVSRLHCLGDPSGWHRQWRHLHSTGTAQLKLYKMIVIHPSYDTTLHSVNNKRPGPILHLPSLSMQMASNRLRCAS